MAFTSLDLIVRLLVIERKDAIPWGVDPAADSDEGKEQSPANDNQVSASLGNALHPTEPINLTLYGSSGAAEQSKIPADTNDAVQRTITPLDVLSRLLTSPRAMVCVFSTFVYG